MRLGAQERMKTKEKKEVVAKEETVFVEKEGREKEGRKKVK